MAAEPVGSKFDDVLEGTRFGKQVGRAGHDFQCLLDVQPYISLFIEFDYHVIEPADDQERRRGYVIEHRAGEIRAATS